MSCIVNVKKVIGWYLYIQHQRINCLFAIIWQGWVSGSISNSSTYRMDSNTKV
jgi:hypothetical protein